MNYYGIDVIMDPDNVLILDAFLANSWAPEGLLKIVRVPGPRGLRRRDRKKAFRMEADRSGKRAFGSLAVVSRIEEGRIVFAE